MDKMDSKVKLPSDKELEESGTVSEDTLTYLTKVVSLKIDRKIRSLYKREGYSFSDIYELVNWHVHNVKYDKNSPRRRSIKFISQNAYFYTLSWFRNSFKNDDDPVSLDKVNDSMGDIKELTCSLDDVGKRIDYELIMNVVYDKCKQLNTKRIDNVMFLKLLLEYDFSFNAIAEKLGLSRQYVYEKFNYLLDTIGKTIRLTFPEYVEGNIITTINRGNKQNA